MRSTVASFVTMLPGLVTGALSYADAPAINATRDVVSAVTDADLRDFVPFPPSTTQAVSPDGRYVFLVQSSDGWQSKHTTGRLLKNTPDGQQLVWERVLAQEYGPRYILVGDQGQTVLFDESINVKSRYAVVLINYEKKLDVTHNFDAVAQTLGVPVAAIVRRAKSGWWIEGKPSLDATGARAMVAAAGKCLAIDLNTGQLSLASSPQKCRP